MRERDKHHIQEFAEKLVQFLCADIKPGTPHMVCSVPPQLAIFYHEKEDGTDIPKFFQVQQVSYFQKYNKKALKPFIHNVLEMVRMDNIFPFGVLFVSEGYVANRDMDPSLSNEEARKKAKGEIPVSEMPDRMEAIMVSISGEDWEEIRIYPYAFEDEKAKIMTSKIQICNSSMWKDAEGLFWGLYKK